MSDTAKRERVLTGDTPTGRLHLGHWVGSLENRVGMQDDYECFNILADLHTLTTRPKAEQIRGLPKSVREMVVDLLSVGIDPERGWLAVGGEVETGDRLLFVRRDPAGAEQDLGRMVSELAGRLPGPARGGLYFSCVARGPSLFGREGREMEIVGEALGDVPIVGFFGQGEISNNRLYGYTGVLALFL